MAAEVFVCVPAIFHGLEPSPLNVSVQIPASVVVVGVCPPARNVRPAPAILRKSWHWALSSLLCLVPLLMTFRVRLKSVRPTRIPESEKMKYIGPGPARAKSSTHSVPGTSQKVSVEMLFYSQTDNERGSDFCFVSGDEVENFIKQD